jgi:hypothetical protein
MSSPSIRKRQVAVLARFTFLVLSAVLVITGCGNGQPAQTSVSADRGTLVGAWRSKVVFRSGPLAEMKGLNSCMRTTAAAR